MPVDGERTPPAERHPGQEVQSVWPPQLPAFSSGTAPERGAENPPRPCPWPFLVVPRLRCPADAALSHPWGPAGSCATKEERRPPYGSSEKGITSNLCAFV